MFLRNDQWSEHSGGASTLTFGRAIVPVKRTALDRIGERFPDFELVPDLGSRIGSAEWARGVLTCAGLLFTVYQLSPGFDRPILGHVAPVMDDESWEAARSQSISALALGSATGRRTAPTAAVAPLPETPERPILELTAIVGSGDRFGRALERAGVGQADAARVASLVGEAIDAETISSGTRIDLTLGRRPDKTVARPLDHLAFRARFDLAIEVARVDGALTLRRIPIAIDNTPLRIRGTVGSSLYRTARAAGAPAKAVEAFIKSIADRVPMSRIGADDRFELVIEQARAETGEVRIGQLLYAGLDQGRTHTRLVRWEQDGRTVWYDANGVGERRGMMAMPVNGRMSSSFGYRTHPILGFRRLHKGMDIAAPTGTPIRAANDGTVAFSGRNGGYGNYVRINHGGGIQTAYGHMSRIAVRNGVRVSRGQVIGYVGSTGMSSGPHLHYELWRNGVAVNPRSVSFSSTERLSGAELARFKNRLATLMSAPVAGTTKPD